MTIHIEDLTFDTIIGLLDFERVTPQRVVIDITIEYAYSNQDFINYAEVAQLIEEELKEREYKLLEDALLGLESCISRVYPHIERLTIKITKPDILPHATVALSHTWIF